ncbi:MAG: hypothetical protein AB7K36_14950 [Chloroflexota bacterium]
MRLVQMPPHLIRVDEADLVAADIEPGVLAQFQTYLPSVLEERRGVALLLPTGAGGDMLLMLLARRVGAALRDENIRLRDTGGDIKGEKKRLCYLPGDVLYEAYDTAADRQSLANEAACFFQDLDAVWAGRVPESATPRPDTFLALLDVRLAAGLPTFLNADPSTLPPAVLDGLRARLQVIEPA